MYDFTRTNNKSNKKWKQIKQGKTPTWKGSHRGQKAKIKVYYERGSEYVFDIVGEHGQILGGKTGYPTKRKAVRAVKNFVKRENKKKEKKLRRILLM